MASASEMPAFPYAYLQRLEAPNSPPALVKIEFDLPEITVGRGKDNSIVIPDLLVSRKHVTFKTNKDNGWLIESVGMNGTSVNGVVLVKNTPTPLKHLDRIEFGAGGKFVFEFRMKSVDVGTADVSRRSFAMESRPSARDSPAAFRDFVQSRRSVERTLMEESVVLDQKLEEQTSKKNRLVREQQKLEEHSNKLREELETQFAQERKALEEKGQLEKSELQKEKAELEERMTKIFKQFQEECRQKSLQLQQSVETANAEKTALLEQKEIIVQQLLGEKQLLQELLEEERRLKESAAAAQAQAEAELANSREAIRRLEEEKKLLEERGSEGEVRFRQVEEALAAKQREMEDFQSRNLIGLDYYEMARINVEEGTVAVPEAQAQAASPAPDVEAEIKRRVTEEMSETIENMATSLECNICSEPIIVAISLNCCHTFCQYCINQWKRNKNDCPSCRTPITSESRHHFIDNVIETMINKLPEEAKAQRRELVKQRAELVQRLAQPAPQPVANAVRHVIQIPGLTGDAAHDHPIIVAHIQAERARIVDVIRGRLTPTPPPRQPAQRPVAPAQIVAAQAAPVAAIAQHGANVIRINIPQHQVRPATFNNPAGQQPRAQVRYLQARPAVPAGQQQRVHVRLAQARPAAAPNAAAVVEEEVVLVESSDDEANRPTRNATPRRNRRNRVENNNDNVTIVREVASTRARNKRSLCHSCGTIMPVNSPCRFCTT